MANPYFGTLADVWKHLVLAEVLRAERPERYAETHAGNASYPMVDDAERRFGIRHAATALPPCTYLDVVRPYLVTGTYTGSAAIAMSIRPEAELLLCDTDPVSTADLREQARRRGVAHADVRTTDGLGAVPVWTSATDRPTVVLIDPFDPWAGTSPALDVAREIARAGYALILWYGYDVPGDRSWALDELHLPDLWCGDLLVTTAEHTVDDEDGDLGEATTPGTGCGVILAGVGTGVARRCAQLGEALVRGYAGATLPDGRPGALDLLVDVT